MRRHLQPEPASGPLYLSREEEAILNDEQNVIVDTIAQQNTEVDRVLEVCENVQFAQGVVAEVTDMSPVEGDLLAAVGDMAVAGTDADPGDLMDEVTAGALVSTESFADAAIKKVMEIWAKLKELLVNAYKALHQFFVGRDRQIGNIETAQVELEKFVEEHKPAILLLSHDPSKDQESKKALQDKALADLKTKLEHHKFKFRGPLGMLSTLSGVPKDFDRALQETLHYSETTYKDIGKALRSICYGFDKAISAFDTATPDKGMLAYLDEFHKTLGQVMNIVGNKKEDSGMSLARTKQPLLGGFTIAVSDKSGNGSGSLAASLKLAGSATLEVSFARDHGGDAEVPLLPTGNAQQRGAIITKYLNYAKSNDAAGLEKELADYGQKFVAHIDKVMAAQQSVKGQVGGEGQEDPYELLQGMIALCKGINQLVVGFTSSHMRGTLNLLRAVQHYQEQSDKERVRLYDEVMKAA